MILMIKCIITYWMLHVELKHFWHVKHDNYHVTWKKNHYEFSKIMCRCLICNSRRIIMYSMEILCQEIWWREVGPVNSSGYDTVGVVSLPRWPHHCESMVSRMTTSLWEHGCLSCSQDFCTLGFFWRPWQNPGSSGWNNKKHLFHSKLGEYIRGHRGSMWWETKI